MMKAIVTTFSILLASAAHGATCQPGPQSYPQALTLVLKDFVSQDENVQMNYTSGRLTISLLNDEVIGRTTNGYISKITVHSSYGQIVDGFGVKVRKTTYVVRTNQSCTGFTIDSVSSEPLLGITPHPDASRAAKLALNEYSQSPKLIPFNTHSGEHSIRIFMPDVCQNGGISSVNIQRTYHHSSGLISLVSSYQVNTGSGKIERSSVQPGKILPLMCP